VAAHTVVDGRGIGMLGCQPVVDRDHRVCAADGVFARRSVVGVEVADGENRRRGSTS